MMVGFCYFTGMHDYGFKPETLIGITQDTGTEPSEDDTYDPGIPL